ncbi:antibiotic biosynthesis monooxygenase [Silvimonas iriomotensis]|uniref:Antibiotic biosynthesis monooxygenase n=1 Tax=Silvimonas iriomotensis TaxID=449662 RepID=A0ABQ2PBV3_9NEIS|nr:antibiotic biosynthesis monooxygenase [Silvimonas iriomotensis]GGP22696.1 hypothetical protein GCM10010970_26960 [Silvimonas iriomotensis]
MTSTLSNTPAIPTATRDTVFRVDQFVVPDHALPAFMKQAHRIDALLHEMPGCDHHLVLTRKQDIDSTRVLTLVQWHNQAGMAAAKALVQQIYASEGFEPQAFIQKLGVTADFGIYGLV